MEELLVRILGGILMSRSYRKNVYASIFGSRSMKAWRTQENRRLRHNAKQLINICNDYDNLIIPVLNDYDTLWGSPQDGTKHLVKKPLLNQCERDSEKWRMQVNRYSWGGGRHELNKEGHLKNYSCSCYSNKRSAYYWCVKRK